MNEPETETGQKPTSNPNPAERRNSLFAYLGHAIRLSHEKMSSKGNSDSAKQAWGRLMVTAFAISKAVRRSQKKFIAVTCRYDVVDWLDPDWVFTTDTLEFSRKKELGRPLNSKSVGAALPCGKCFGNIII